jgi:hypothetical protein
LLPSLARHLLVLCNALGCDRPNGLHFTLVLLHRLRVVQRPALLRGLVVSYDGSSSRLLCQ